MQIPVVQGSISAAINSLESELRLKVGADIINEFIRHLDTFLLKPSSKTSSNLKALSVELRLFLKWKFLRQFLETYLSYKQAMASGSSKAEWMRTQATEADIPLLSEDVSAPHWSAQSSHNQYHGDPFHG